MAASIADVVSVRPLAEARAASLPAYLKALLFASTSIVTGMLWDIAWHRSIGRDTFWSPPHIGLYLGAVVAGLASAAVILHTTFAGTAEARARGVRMWGLTGPLGAFFCGWGAGAMLTSAPFDDWWHNTYGLDTKVLSPPHVVLIIGIVFIQVGVMLTALALQNRQGRGQEPGSPAASRSGAGLAYAYAAGVLLITAGIFISEYTNRVLAHSSIYYQVISALFPLFLVAVACGSTLRWPATTAALIYAGVTLINHWIMPLVPAEPKLGPVRQVVTHMMPGAFPLLIVAPALAIDYLRRRRWSGKASGSLALAMGTAFFVGFLAVQWPFANFLMTPAARNWVFHAHAVSYMTPSTSYQVRHEFYNWDSDPATRWRRLAYCVPLATMSAWLGLLWGGWMSRVRR
jgi:hypothetical protein